MDRRHRTDARRADVYSVIPDIDNAELADWLLAHGFGQQPAANTVSEPGTAASAGVVTTMYHLGASDSWVHDMIIEPATGAAWAGDYPHDRLIRVDLRTGAQKHHRRRCRWRACIPCTSTQPVSLWIIAAVDRHGGAFRPP